MFGPNAKLDVQRSFHASTADYLRLKDGVRFNARLGNDSELTIASVETFGFLGSSEPIYVEGGEIKNWEKTGLEVPEGQTLSLIGGNLTIKNGAFFKTELISARTYGSGNGGNINLDVGQLYIRNR